MSKLTDLMTAAIASLQSRLNTGNGAVTLADIVAKIHEVVDQQIADLTSAIASIHAGDATDEQKLSEVTDAITLFAAAFAPASTPAANTNTPPAPATAPTAPAPEPIPAPAVTPEESAPAENPAA